MNTTITFTQWSEQIHEDIPTISTWKKRHGRDSVFPFPQQVSKCGLEKFYVKEELDNWLAVFRANYPLQNHLFVHSADREVVMATRRLIQIQEIFDRTGREIEVLKKFLENTNKGETK
jgi:hypothetical protein